MTKTQEQCYGIIDHTDEVKAAMPTAAPLIDKLDLNIIEE